MSRHEIETGRGRTAEHNKYTGRLPRSRSIAMYSPAKVGKSLVALHVSVGLATGARVFDSPPGAPVEVCYFDFEMSEQDLWERLEDMGYGPDADLAHFHYFMLPSLPPLDTAEGGEAIIALTRRHAAQLVVIDTTSRVLSGEENSADTIRAYYLHTGRPLKAEGLTIWRLDHAGKDVTRGQRVTSAKVDGVDLVWRLMPVQDGLQLQATHRRQSWIPDRVDLRRLSEPLRFELANAPSWPSGTKETADNLDGLNVPFDASTRAAQQALKDAGYKVRRAVVTAAVKWRKNTGTAAGTTSDKASGTTSGNQSPNSFGNQGGNHAEPPDAVGREPGSPLWGNRYHRRTARSVEVSEKSPGTSGAGVTSASLHWCWR